MVPDLIIGLGVVVLAAMFLLCWRAPTYALALALLSLTLRPELLWGGPHLSDEWGYHHTLVALALVANLIHFGSQRFISWPIVGLVMIFILNLLFGHLLNGLTLNFMLISAALLALPFAFTQVKLAPHARSVGSAVLMALPLLSVLIGIFLQLFDLRITFAGLWDRLEGGTGNAGVFGILAFAGFAVALHESAAKGRTWAGVFVAVNVTLVFFSGARMAIFASALLFTTYVIASRRVRVRFRQNPMKVSIGIFTIAAIAAPYTPKVLDRMMSKMDRVRFWQVFFDEFLKSPWFGRGIGSVFLAESYWPDHVEKPYLPVPHNEYLHILTVGGVFGFGICAVCLVLWYYRLIMIASDYDKKFLISLFPAICLYSVTENLLIYSSALTIYAYLGLISQSTPKSVPKLPPLNISAKARP